MFIKRRWVIFKVRVYSHVILFLFVMSVIDETIVIVIISRQIFCIVFFFVIKRLRCFGYIDGRCRSGPCVVLIVVALIWWCLLWFAEVGWLLKVYRFGSDFAWFFAEEMTLEFILLFCCLGRICLFISFFHLFHHAWRENLDHKGISWLGKNTFWTLAQIVIMNLVPFNVIMGVFKLLNYFLSNVFFLTL